MEVDPSLLHRLFYPQVPVVLSAGYRRRVSAMPVVSYASASVRPPMVVIGCNPASFTLTLASKAGAFSLCLLDRRHLGALERLASISGRETKDKIAGSGLSHRRAATVNAPIINEADATLECKLDSEKKVGDHILLVGRVRSCYTSENFSDFWDFERYKPILYTGWKEGLSTFPMG